MLVYVFKSFDGVYGFTKSETGENLPSNCAPWTSFKSIQLNEHDAPRFGLKAPEAMKIIDRDGYYLSKISIKFEEFE